MKLHGGHIVVISGSRGMGLAAARLAQDEGAEVTIASRSQEKLIQVQSELEPVHTVVMDVADEGAVEKNVAALSRVDHGYISAGIMLNGAIMHNGRSSPWLVPLVSSSSKVYTTCRQLDVLRHGSHGQA
jgi:NADP-dependent 3-hydroxy acid dehydrogenase YdfG